MKKMLGLVLALVMVCSATQVLASTTQESKAIPSKTTGDMTSVESIVSEETGQPISFQIVLQELNDTAAKVLEEIFTFSQTAAPVQYFDEETKQAIAALLPEGFNLDSLDMNEFMPIEVFNYDESYGNAVVSFEFTAEYTDGQPIVALVGIKGEDGVSWTALKAEVVDGFIKIYFTKEVLVMIQSGDAMLAILSGAASAN